MTTNGPVWSPTVPFCVPWSGLVHLGPSNGLPWTFMVPHSPIMDSLVPNCPEGFCTKWYGSLQPVWTTIVLYGHVWSTRFLYEPTGSPLRCVSNLILHELTQNSKLRDTLLTLKFFKVKGLLTCHIDPQWSCMVPHDCPMVPYWPLWSPAFPCWSFSTPLSWRVPYKFMWLSITFLINHGLIWSWRVNPGAVWTYWVPFRVPNEQVWCYKKGNKIKKGRGYP